MQALVQPAADLHMSAAVGEGLFCPCGGTRASPRQDDLGLETRLMAKR